MKFLTSIIALLLIVAIGGCDCGSKQEAINEYTGVVINKGYRTPVPGGVLSPSVKERFSVSIQLPDGQRRLFSEIWRFGAEKNFATIREVYYSYKIGETATFLWRE